MHRVRVAALLCACLCGAAWACGSFGTSDAGPDAGAGNGPADAGPLDAAAVDGIAPGTRFCDAHKDAGLCLDFDDPVAPTSPFGFGAVAALSGTGKLALDETAPASPPRSLLTSTASGGSAEMQVLLTQVPTQLDVRWAFKLDELDAAGTSSSHMVSLRCVSSETTQIYTKVEANGDLGFTQSDGGPNPTPTFPLTLGKWTRLAVIFKPGAAGTYLIDVLIDGSPNFVNQQSYPLACDSQGAVLRFGTHISGGGGVAGDYVFHFDDVLVDWK